MFNKIKDKIDIILANILFECVAQFLLLIIYFMRFIVLIVNPYAINIADGYISEFYEIYNKTKEEINNPNVE